LELSKAEFQHSEPVVYYVDNPVDGGATAVLVGEGEGYGGPMVLAIKARRTEPVRRLVEVVLLDNRETPPGI
jgi:hypothetical protein